jgi:hypothetical protein
MTVEFSAMRCGNRLKPDPRASPSLCCINTLELTNLRFAGWNTVGGLSEQKKRLSIAVEVAANRQYFSW